jgi:hypothetical protein
MVIQGYQANAAPLAVPPFAAMSLFAELDTTESQCNRIVQRQLPPCSLTAISLSVKLTTSLALDERTLTERPPEETGRRPVAFRLRSPTYSSRGCLLR